MLLNAIERIIKNNKKEIAIRQKKYREKNKDILAIHARKYKEDNREKIKAAGKEYYEEHKEKINKYSVAWNKANPEKRALSVKKWAQNNPEKLRLARHRRRARELSLPDTLTEDEWQAILKVFDYRCAYCGAEWTDRDHFIPLSKGGGTVKENIVPACNSCNSRKQAKMPEDYCTEEKHTWIIELIGGIL